MSHTNRVSTVINWYANGSPVVSLCCCWCFFSFIVLLHTIFMTYLYKRNWNNQRPRAYDYNFYQKITTAEIMPVYNQLLFMFIVDRVCLYHLQLMWMYSRKRASIDFVCFFVLSLSLALVVKPFEKCYKNLSDSWHWCTIKCLANVNFDQFINAETTAHAHCDEHRSCAQRNHESTAQTSFHKIRPNQIEYCIIELARRCSFQSIEISRARRILIYCRRASAHTHTKKHRKPSNKTSHSF